MQAAADLCRTKALALILCAAIAACAPVCGPDDARSTAASDNTGAFLAAIAPAAGPLSCPERLHLGAATRQAAPAALPLALQFADPETAEAVVQDVELTGDADCLLLLDRPVVERTELDYLGTRSLEATRVTGIRHRTNPERRQLERRLAELRHQAWDDDPEVLRTGEPTVDLIGLVAGAVLGTIEQFAGRDAEIAALEAKLEATPPTLVEETVETVPLLVERYEITAIGRTRAALIDRTHDLAWEQTIPLRATRTVDLLPADAPSNLRLPQRADLVYVRDRQALDALRLQPPPISLASLLRAFAGAMPATPEGITLASLERRWASDRQAAGQGGAAVALADLEPAAPPAPSVTFSPSVVVIGDGEGPRALGFYVGREHVLTLASTLPPSTLVPVAVAPGLVTFALVESRDDTRDLALVWLPKAGEPLAIAAPPVPAGSPRLLRSIVGGDEDLPGAPLVTEAGVVALKRPGAAGDRIDARELRRFLAVARDRDGVRIAFAGGG